MIRDIQRLLDQYTAWLRDQTTLRQINEWVEITTPFLDRHNDHIQIYAKRDCDNWTITDDGYIIEDLKQSGCEIEPGSRRHTLLTTTLNGFGVNSDEGRLTVEANENQFSRRKHNLVQAMIAVNDLFYLAQPMVASLFLEDVESWLRTSRIRYTPNVKFTGASGYDHQFHFVIPESDVQPERVVQPVNRPSRDRAQTVAFAWIDTKSVRPRGSRAYVLLNDEAGSINPNILGALRSYEINPVQWSAREGVVEELAA